MTSLKPFLHHTNSKFSQQISPLPCLPNDVIVEILLKLPVKSLVRFCCVCKLFQCLITSDGFARSHLLTSLNNANANGNGDYPSGRKNVLFNPYLFDGPNIGFIKRISQELPRVLADSGSCRLIMAEDDFHLAGCYDGIICLYEFRGGYSDFRIYLCNPALGQFRVLPKSNNYIDYRRSGHYIKGRSRACLVFEPVSHDYKVITIMNYVKQNYDMEVSFMMVEIYNMSDNSWKGIILDIATSDPALHNGSIYWITRERGDGSGNVLNVLDLDLLAQEKIEEIELPDELLQLRVLNFLRYRGSLAIGSFLSAQVMIQLWVMKEDGVSWEKEVVDVNPQPICDRLSINASIRPWCLYCKTPWDTTCWAYLINYGEGIIFFRDAENERLEECTIAGNNEALSFHFGYIAVNYVASLISISHIPLQNWENKDIYL